MYSNATADDSGCSNPQQYGKIPIEQKTQRFLKDAGTFPQDEKISVENKEEVT